MAKGMVEFIDPIKLFEGWALCLSSPLDYKNLFPLLRRFGNHIYLREQIIYHKGDFSSVIKRFKSLSEISITQDESKPWLITAKTFSKTNGDFVTGSLLIIPSKFPNMYKVVSVSKSPFWNLVARKLFRKAYPIAMRVFFRQEEIQKAFEVYEEMLGEDHRVNVLEATLKAKRYSNNKNTYRQFNTDRVWRDQPIKDMFDDAAEKGQWFSSLKFATQKFSVRSKKHNTVAICKLNKFGEIFRDFYFEEIDDGFISILEGFASERLELFQNRGLRERDFKPSPPLEITYNIDLFNDLEEIRKFGRSMEKYPDSTIAVFHGNPYYHASIADFSDGSSFDVWILSPRRILIAPQAKSTPQAFERLTSYIFYEFREGEVKEYAE